MEIVFEAASTEQHFEQILQLQKQNLFTEIDEDQQAQQGWEFYSLEKVNIQINPGCIGQLLGQSASFITVDQVIFRQGNE